MNLDKALYSSLVIQSIKEKIKAKPVISYLLQSVIGSVFLGIISQFSVTLPFTPVPISLQTLGVLALIIFQGRASVGSIGLYLVQASMGLPVLAGGRIDPLWFLGPTAGYLFGCLFAAYPASAFYQKNLSWSRALGALLLAQVIILFFGAIWLSLFVGISSAYALGVVPFIFNAAIKTLMALGLVFPLQWVKSFLAKF